MKLLSYNRPSYTQTPGTLAILWGEKFCTCFAPHPDGNGPTKITVTHLNSQRKSKLLRFHVKHAYASSYRGVIKEEYGTQNWAEKELVFHLHVYFFVIICVIFLYVVIVIFVIVTVIFVVVTVIITVTIVTVIFLFIVFIVVIVLTVILWRPGLILLRLRLKSRSTKGRTLFKVSNKVPGTKISSLKTFIL